MKCRYCKTDLIRDKERGCLVCPNCSPKQRGKPIPPKEEKKYLDVKVTEKRVSEIIDEKLAEQVEVGEERIREIVRDELEDWHIPKPPVIREEIIDARTRINVASSSNADVPIETAENPVETVEEMNWRQRAKELGIELYHKKKVDVLKEIKALTPLTDKI